MRSNVTMLVLAVVLLVAGLGLAWRLFAWLTDDTQGVRWAPRRRMLR